MDYEGSEDEETALPRELVGCTQEKNSGFLDLLAPDFSSLTGGAEIDMREIESIHKNFAECMAEGNLRASLIGKNGTVIEEVPCMVEKRGCVSSRDEEESYLNVNEVKRKSNSSFCPVSVRSGSWQRSD